MEFGLGTMPDPPRPFFVSVFCALSVHARKVHDLRHVRLRDLVRRTASKFCLSSKWNRPVHFTLRGAVDLIGGPDRRGLATGLVQTNPIVGASRRNL